MNICVDFETAKELSTNGFPQPGYPIPNQSEVVGKLFYSPSGNKFLGCWQESDNSITLQPHLHNKETSGVTKVCFAPTAIEIIEQMPEGTHIKKNLDGLWYVWFNLPSMQHDFRHDKCPHVAAAKAFIAWKKGLET